MPVNRTAEVDRPGDIVQVVHRRVGDVVGTIDLFGLARLVRHIFVAQRQDGEDHTFGVAQRDVLARLDLGGELPLSTRRA